MKFAHIAAIAALTLSASTAAFADYLPNKDDMTMSFDRKADHRQQIASVGICLKVRGINYEFIIGRGWDNLVVFGGAKASPKRRGEIEDCFKQ